MSHLFLLEDNTPSPNSYTLPALMGPKVPTKASVPAYSMAGRVHTGSFSEDLAKSPGPGRYNIVAPDIYSKRSPAYSMLRRNYMPESMLIVDWCVFVMYSCFFTPVNVTCSTKTVQLVVQVTNAEG